jgi:1-acyl-sn-glycerol-3-phosphate acyltransferase
VSVRLVVPPKPIRRLVLAPAMVALTVVVLAITPLVVLALAFAVRLLPGRWRALRLFWFALVYLVRESVGVVALAVLWVLSGFGWKLRSERFELAHVALVGWFLRGLVRAASRVLGLVLVTESVPATGDGPVLVFSRHAGAGDSFILVHLLVNTYHRRPHIVLKEALQLDPCIDIVLNRLPNRFIPSRHHGSEVVGSIAELAADLEADGALILFPEGGNFTEGRRTRAIERLERDGHHRAVELAHELTYVLPPRPGGAFAAIDAAPDADVLFVAHTGLEQLSSVRDLWNGLPMDREVRLAWWTEPAERVPAAPDERIEWLFGWWEDLDTWIEQRRDPDRPATPAIATDEEPG